ncbi:MAG: hypothetical protein P4M11_10370, partial [Candidatus Pacebacteria bacterium]|nr:hypothetical protein [Candidatus Paceibacterota bacterium]
KVKNFKVYDATKVRSSYTKEDAKPSLYRAMMVKQLEPTAETTEKESWCCWIRAYDRASAAKFVHQQQALFPEASRHMTAEMRDPRRVCFLDRNSSLSPEERLYGMLNVITLPLFSVCGWGGAANMLNKFEL